VFTYHSALGVHVKQKGDTSYSGGSRASIADARERLAGVEYVFIDEISMVACHELFAISSRLAGIFNIHDMPFGGVNIILAGDFAQLPPTKGNPLYSNLRLCVRKCVNYIQYNTLQSNRNLIQLHNATQRSKVFERKTDDYKRIMMLIASNDIAGLRRLISAALRGGVSAEVIIDQIQKSINGLYSPRGGFSERDLDIAFLVKAIGGPRLLYALQKSHGLASESTIRRCRKIPHLLAAVSTPSKPENDCNMTTFLDPTIKPPPPLVNGIIPGNVVMFDGVALETKCRYCPERNQIMGLCREHSRNVKTEVTDQQSIEDVRAALFDSESSESKVCFGSDATVVAIAPYA